MLQVCLQQSWPQDKPIVETVFPQILPSCLDNLVTLWVMLQPEEVQHHLFSKPHREFLFTESPYPMLLWLSVLHSQEQGSQWLPCYLDLKAPNNQEIVQRLAQTGYYRLLLFSTNEPQRCVQVMTVTLNPEQCQMLQNWVKVCQALQPTARPIDSRHLLKTEFEKLKSQLMVKLDSKNLAISSAL